LYNNLLGEEIEEPDEDDLIYSFALLEHVNQIPDLRQCQLCSSKQMNTNRDIWRRELVNWPNRAVIFLFNSKQAFFQTGFSEHAFSTFDLMFC